MDANLPEIPTVEQSARFPWSAVSKFQWGVIIMLLVWIYKGGVSGDERSMYQNKIAEANDKLFKYQEERIAQLTNSEAKDQQIKLYQDSMNRLKDKIKIELLPPSNKILNK